MSRMCFLRSFQTEKRKRFFRTFSSRIKNQFPLALHGYRESFNFFHIVRKNILPNKKICWKKKKYFFRVVKNFPQIIQNTREIIENMSEIF